MIADLGGGRSGGAREPARVSSPIPEPFLDHILGHDELRMIPRELLPRLAREIREKLHQTISLVPGHYASNLGVVELTIALHVAFDFRRDRLVFDVGHQAYPHKMLTGRARLFSTLRQENGLCGFPLPEESQEYDLFHTSHAGCAVSSVLGLAAADRLLGRDAHRVAVVGDGALTAGLVFEALNHAGFLREDVLVVFNDNGCSISYNTGALSVSCSRLRATPAPRPEVRESLDPIETIPFITENQVTVPRFPRNGKPAAARGGEGQLPPGDFFRSLGFSYSGPVDGHDIEGLLGTLAELKGRRGPRVLHVITQKGRGFPWSEKDPVTWHGGKPYEVQGDRAVWKRPSAPRPPDFWELMSDAVVEAGGDDPRVVAVTAAMAEGTGLKKFQRAYPERFFDVGICEQHGVCFSAAMARGGLRPVACIYSTFLQRAMDQLMHDVALQDGLPVVLCLDRAGLVGDDGATANGVFDIAYLRALPFWVLLAPKDGPEARAMLRWALSQGRPAAIRTPKEPVPAPPLSAEAAPVELGKGEVLRRGERLAYLAYGAGVVRAVEAARRLEEEDGLRATVANARFAKPLDGDLLEELLATHERVLTVEDHQLMNGFGSAVLEEASRRGLESGRIARLGIPDRFISFGSREWQLRQCGLDAGGLLRAGREALGGLA